MSDAEQAARTIANVRRIQTQRSNNYLRNALVLEHSTIVSRSQVPKILFGFGAVSYAECPLLMMSIKRKTRNKYDRVLQHLSNFLGTRAVFID